MGTYEMESVRPIVVVDEKIHSGELLRIALKEAHPSKEVIVLRSREDVMLYLQDNVRGVAPSLIVLSLNASSENTEEIVRLLETTGDGVPVVVVTSERQFGEESTSLPDADAYVRQPATFDEFREAVREISSLTVH